MQRFAFLPSLPAAGRGLIAGLSLALGLASLPASGQDRIDDPDTARHVQGVWVPDSDTAASITGAISLRENAIAFENGVRMTLASLPLPAAAAVKDGPAPEGLFFRVTTGAQASLLNGNTLACRDDAQTYLSIHRISAPPAPMPAARVNKLPTLVLTVYSATSLDALQTCGSFTYRLPT